MTLVAEVGYYEPWWMQLLKALVIFAVVFQLVPIVLLAERKILGRFQHRYGPNRVGPFGALTPIADIGKLLFKEQFRPRTATGWLERTQPSISRTSGRGTPASSAGTPSNGSATATASTPPSRRCSRTRSSIDARPRCPPCRRSGGRQRC